MMKKGRSRVLSQEHQQQVACAHAIRTHMQHQLSRDFTALQFVLYVVCYYFKLWLLVRIC